MHISASFNLYSAHFVLESANIVKKAQQSFLTWAQKPSNQRKKSELTTVLGNDFIQLLDKLTIARSRSQIERFYAHEMTRLGSFPARSPTQNHYVSDIDTLHEFPSYDGVAAELEALELAMFNPSESLQKILPVEVQNQYAAARNKGLTQDTREGNLVAIMKVLLLKRLESSVASFASTLGRMITNIDALVNRIEQHQAFAADNPDIDLSDYLPTEDEELLPPEALEVGKKLKYQFVHLDLPKWTSKMHADRAKLADLLTKAQAVTAERDTKLLALQQLIGNKQHEPTIDKNGLANKKLIIFTAFADTAQYLYDNLHASLLRSHGVHSGLVLGGSAKQTLNPTRNKFGEVLADFAPVSKKRQPELGTKQLDMLIATDCISEGQNLQDCDTVINYDIHWNPVRLIQRFGRVDRIGSQATAVHMVNFWPTDHLDKYIKLRDRVETRMAIVDIAATGTDNLLGTEQIEDIVKGDLSMRDQQLKRLQTEVFDLDEDESQITLADLSLDEFRQDLHQFLDAQRKDLEKAPLGLFAVVPPDSQIPQALAGTLFCLREKKQNKTEDAKTIQKPTAQNYYLLYVRTDGQVAMTHLQAKATLNLWRALSIGKTTAYGDLCRVFDRSTNNGTDMSVTTALLQAAIASVKQASQQVAVQKITSQREFILQPHIERLGDDTSFELVTWLVIACTPYLDKKKVSKVSIGGLETTASFNATSRINT